MVEILVRQGANINAQGGRAVILAAAKGQLEALSLLLTVNPSPLSINEALVEAASKGQIEAVKLLLRAGASSQFKGCGALLVALKSGSEDSPELVKVLVLSGCDPTLLPASEMMELLYQGVDSHLAALSILDSLGISPLSWKGELALESFNSQYLKRESARLRAARMALLLGELTISSRKISGFE